MLSHFFGTKIFQASIVYQSMQMIHQISLQIAFEGV